ncbi:KAP family P-loop NTPase fold protein, partial [Bacillus cereus]|uniref:KAP family P-loop NTPase fold protein n=1 Tax=Bacillus cereus TaxID=1396 RepID=UPI001F4F6DC2
MFDILFYLSSLSLLLLAGIYLVNKLKKAEGDKGENEYALHNDDPLQMSEQDALSRKEFAEQLIDPIIKSNGKLTIGIYGPWGSGKSSFFTMMNDCIPKEQLKMNFTPWYFGENTDGIILEFLEHFAEQINKSNYYDTRLEKELAAYANFFKSIQLRPTGATITLGDLFKGFLPEESDIKAIKKVIDNMLIKSDKKIVVFIDDLDRLDREEIITVFKLIRLVCDFPNVVYVLALDEEIVSLALSQVYWKQDTEEQAMLKGREYLEKFIQVPIYLPKVDEVKFKQFFIDGLKEILQKHNIKTGFFENIDSIYPVIDITTFR